MNKKYKILIISFGLIIIIGLIFFLWSNGTIKNRTENALKGDIVSPEFMSAGDKEKFQIPAGTKVQIMSRDGKGEISVYKIVNTDKDIISNPSKIPAISPRQNIPTK